MKDSKISIAEVPIPLCVKAERQVLADILNDEGFMDIAREHLTPSDFSDNDCRSLWKDLVSMHDDGTPIALTTVVGKASDAFFSQIIGTESTPFERTFIEHCRLLHNYGIRRRVYLCAAELLKKSAAGDVSDAWIDDAPKMFEAAIGEGNQRTAAIRISDVINKLADDIQEQEKNAKSGMPNRITTGFHYLDSGMGGGFGPGQLIVLAARPSVGKTSVMLQMARAASRICPVEIFSLEQTEQEIVARNLIATGKITPAHLSREMDWTAYEQAAAYFNNCQMLINTKARSISEICARIRTDARAGRCKVVFLDYLGLVSDDMPNTMPKPQRIGYVTRMLKETAQKSGVPIVLLSQLNRNSAEGNKPPQLYDLRDSGDIGQDADAVLMLQYLDEWDNQTRAEGEDGDVLRMWVRKNRNGKRDWRIFCGIENSYTRFNEKGIAG